MHDVIKFPTPTIVSSSRSDYRDNSECPGRSCPASYRHVHCVLDGAPLIAQGDSYGGLAGYGEDADAIECPQCGRWSHPGCTRRRGNHRICYDCFAGVLA